MSLSWMNWFWRINQNRNNANGDWISKRPQLPLTGAGSVIESEQLQKVTDVLAEMNHNCDDEMNKGGGINSRWKHVPFVNQNVMEHHCITVAGQEMILNHYFWPVTVNSRKASWRTCQITTRGRLVELGATINTREMSRMRPQWQLLEIWCACQLMILSFFGRHHWFVHRLYRAHSRAGHRHQLMLW